MEKGHNSKRVGGVAIDQLKSVIARIERLEQEKAGLAADIKDVLAEARGNGFDVPTIRKILKLRKQDASEREEQETILDVYLNALGMIPQYEMFEEPESACKVSATSGTDATDAELYARAVAVVVRDQKASTSYIQRSLQIGYSRAAELIERMERDGIVAPANHVGKRDVLRGPEGEAA